MAHDILCIGGLHLDLVAQARGRMARGADEPGTVSRSAGGVAFNIARALAAQGLSVRLVSAIGTGPAAEGLEEAVRAAGVTPALLRCDLPGDLYLAIEDTGGLVAAIAESRVLEAAGTAVLDGLGEWEGALVVDSNLPLPVLARLAGRPGLRLASAGSGKAARLAPFLGHAGAIFYLNRAEAGILAGHPAPGAARAARALVARGAARVIVTDGARPVAEAEGATLRQAAPPPVTPARITGAGDAFLAAHVAAELRGAGREAALAAAVAAAAIHIEDPLP